MGDLADTAERLRQAKSGREKFLALYAIDCILDEAAERIARTVHPGRDAANAFGTNSLHPYDDD